MTTTEVPDDADLRRRLPRYRFGARLDKTTMSRVYRATDLVTGEDVVVKLLAPDLRHDPDHEERFAREVRIMLRLDHPGIVPALRGWAHGEPPHLVMPYLPGTDLERLLDAAGALPLDRTVRIIRALADALAHVHDQRVVHRDVKPSNILIGPGDRVHLCDFGIAVELSDLRVTQVGQVMGSAGSSAPETFDGRGDTRGLPVPPDRRADIYSLGTVLHHCLTGRPAFQTMADQQNRDPEPVSALRRELPRALDPVVLRALRRDPAARYDSCPELVGALRRAAARTRWWHGLADDATATARRLVRHPWLRRLAGPVAVGIALLGLLPGVPAGGLPTPAQLARVPAAVRHSCRLGDPAAGMPGAATVLACWMSGRNIHVSLFDRAAGERRAYRGAVHRWGAPTATGDCATDADADAEHRYPAVGAPVGRALCRRRAGRATLVWTNDAARTVSRATGPAAGLAGDWAHWVGLPAFPTPADDRLMMRLNLAGCRRAPGGAEEGLPPLAAAVSCAPGGTGADTLSYYRTDNGADIGTALRHDWAGLPQDVDCAGDQPPDFRGYGTLSLNEIGIGALLCHPDRSGHGFVLEWMFQPLNLVGRATGPSVPALLAWWRWHFRGVSGAVAAAYNASHDFPNPAERRLLAHIPAPSRVNCLRLTQAAMRKGTSRLVRTAVTCGPTPAAGLVTYSQFDTVADMNKALAGGAADAPDSPRACTALPPHFSASTRYARDGGTGRLSCSSNDATLNLTWTDDRLKIMVTAVEASDPAALISWWRTAAGPV